MTEHTSPTRLRADLYRILDRIAETGEDVTITRNGHLIRISAARQPRLNMIRPDPDYLNAPPEDFVHLDWSSEWKP